MLQVFLLLQTSIIGENNTWSKKKHFLCAKSANPLSPNDNKNKKRRSVSVN